MSKGLEHLEILENLVELYGHFSFDFTVIEKELKALEIIKEALDNHGCAVIQYGFVDIKGSIYNDEKVKLLKEVLYD